MENETHGDLEWVVSTEDAQIITEYGNLARFATHGIGGAMGWGIRRGAIRKFVQDYFYAHRRLPSGAHTVCYTYGQSKGRFAAEFPGRDLEEAAVLAIVAPRSGLHQLLHTRLLGSTAAFLQFEQLKQIDIHENGAGRANRPFMRRNWRLVHPERKAIPMTHNCAKSAPITWEGAGIAHSVKVFIELLRRLPLHEQRCIPLIDEPDDHPSVTIRLELNGGVVTVGSQTLGREAVPWYVDIEHRRFVVNCAIPSLALSIIKLMLR